MAYPVRTLEPSLASKYSSRSSSRSLSRPPGPNQDLLDRIHAAENRSHAPRSHAGSLVLAQNHHHHQHRSIEEIDAEIAALEAEAKANEWRRRADAEREREYAIHDRDGNWSRRRSERYDSVEYEVVEEEEKRRVYRRPVYQRDDEMVLFDGGRSRSLPPVGREDSIVPYRPRDEYVVYERRRSPVRNVIRVQKDRKGRMALVKSSR